jgi:hypothetical protein
MALEDIVNVTITTSTQMPTRVGFGTPAVYGYHTAFADKHRAFKSLTALAAAGITSTGVGAGTYHAVAAAFAQNPRPKEVKVLKRTNAFTQIIELTPLNATAGSTYAFDIGPLGGTQSAIARTVPGASSIAAECTALAAAINTALGGTQASGASGTKVVITNATPGMLLQVSNRITTPAGQLEIFDATAAPAAIVADLDAVALLDNDWYGLALDSNSKDEVVIAAGWAESNTKIFGYNTADTACGKSASTTDVMATLQTSSYFRTFGLFNGQSLLTFAGMAWLGEELPKDPGSSQYGMKTLAGVPADSSVDDTAYGVILGKNGNVYQRIAGVAFTYKGKMAAGEWIDTITGRDWMVARMKERVLGLLLNNDKVPFTDTGIAMVENEVRGQCEDAIAVGFLAASPAPTITVPLAADVSAADKAARILRDVTFSGKLAGGVIATEISGNISV